jgi:hypothetical protein
VESACDIVCLVPPGVLLHERNLHHLVDSNSVAVN